MVLPLTTTTDNELAGLVQVTYLGTTTDNEPAGLVQVTYLGTTANGKAAHKVTLSGQCCFDTIKGHLSIAPEEGTKVLGCMMPPRQVIPNPLHAQRSTFETQ